MNTPDKIFIPFLEDDKDGHLCTEWETFPYPLALDNIEYIRKGVLLEWAKEMHEAYRKKYEESNHTCGEHWGQMVAFRRMIDKLNSL